MGNQQGSRLGSEMEAGGISPVTRTNVHTSRNYYDNVPLTFHPIHGTCIRLSDDMTQATRVQSFCNGLSFSNRPVAVGERISITCMQSSASWSGSIRIGFTTWDPSNFDSSQLPKYSCPDLANNPGFWVKALPENTLAKENDGLTFYYNKVGTVFIGSGPDNMSPFICGLEVSKPLWAIIDIYGNTVAVSIRSSMRSAKGRTPKSNNLPPEVMRLAKADNSNALSNSPRQSDSLHQVRSSGGEGLPPSRTYSLPSSSGDGTRKVATPTLPPLNHFGSLAIVRNISFSSVLSGKNVALTHDGTVAVRSQGEFCNAYVFTSHPIALGTKVAVQIVNVTSEYRGGLTFGITAADLANINQDSLPNNSDDLLDRSEYWVVNKDVCVNLSRGDEILFSFVPPGAIQISRNNHQPSTLMYVDGSLSLTFFFDLYGSVESIRLLGTVDTLRPTVVSLPPRNAPTATNNTGISRQKQLTANAAARIAGRPQHSVPSPRQETSNVERTVSEQSSVPPALPPPLVPVPVRVTKPPNSPPRATGPPPVPARPDKASLIKPPVAPRPLAPNRLTEQTAKTKGTASPGTQSITSLSSPGTPSSSTIDAFRQNAQNEINNTEDSGTELLTNECTVCLAAQVDCALYSCGHLCLCYSCAQTVRKADNLCPICRESIKDVIRVFKC